MNGKHWAISIVLMMFAAFFGGAVSSWLFSTQPVFAGSLDDPENVSAKAFHLVDGKDYIRASLAFDEDKYPALTFYDKYGKTRIGLKQYDEFSILQFNSEEQEAQLSLSATSEGGAGLYVWPDKFTKDPIISIGLWKDGSHRIDLFSDDKPNDPDEILAIVKSLITSWEASLSKNRDR